MIKLRLASLSLCIMAARAACMKERIELEGEDGSTPSNPPRFLDDRLPTERKPIEGWRAQQYEMDQKSHDNAEQGV